MAVVDWFFRFLHIISGVAWVGAIFLWGMVIVPTLQKRLPPQVAGPFMKEAVPRISRFMTISGVLTVLTGFITMGFLWGARDMWAVFQQGTYGASLGVGAVAALVMLGVGVFVIIPAANRMLELGARAGPDGPGPEMASLQKRLKMMTMLNILLGTLALAAMALAVNVRAG